MTLSPKLTVFDMDGTFIHAEHEFFLGVANRIFSEMSLPARDPEIMKQFISESRFFDILEKDKTQEGTFEDCG